MLCVAGTGAVGRVLGSLGKLKPLVKVVGKGATAIAHVIDAGMFALNFARLVTQECIHVFYPGICDKQEEVTQLTDDINSLVAALNETKLEVESQQVILETFYALLYLMNNYNSLIADLYNGIVEQTAEIENLKRDIEGAIGVDKADEIILRGFDIALAIAASAKQQVQAFIDEAGVNTAIQGALLAFTLVGIPLLKKGFSTLKVNYETKTLASGPKGRTRTGAVTSLSGPTRLGRRLRVKGRIVKAGTRLLKGAAWALPVAGSGIALGLSIKAEADVSRYLSEALDNLRQTKVETEQKLSKARQTRENQGKQWEDFQQFFIDMTATFENSSAPIMSSMCDACADCSEVIQNMCSEGCNGDLACTQQCEAVKSNAICRTCSAAQKLFFCTPLATLVGEGLTADNLNLLLDVQNKTVQLLSSHNNTLATVRQHLEHQRDAINFIKNAAMLSPPKPLLNIVQDLTLNKNFPNLRKTQVLDILRHAFPDRLTYDGCNLQTGQCWQDTALMLVDQSASIDVIVERAREAESTVTKEDVYALIHASKPMLTSYGGCLVSAPYTCMNEKIRSLSAHTIAVPAILDVLTSFGFNATERQVLEVIAQLRPTETTYGSCDLRSLSCS